ncbi:hypothetical protein EON63_11020 [archaeon]|nr:MAG: hypothetical protein EON63_11020 [archaeon]
MASSSSLSRKRSIGAIELEDEEDLENDQHDLVFEPYNPSYSLEMAKVAVTEREKNKFERLTDEAQKECIRVVSRLFLFKGKFNW